MGAEQFYAVWTFAVVRKFQDVIQKKAKVRRGGYGGRRSGRVLVHRGFGDILAEDMHVKEESLLASSFF